ncbi:hypothetical protein [Brevundimonas sp. FT23042]|uniref:hypothetical protein n=1 Tax=Brevundimonas sp. FT23042 TaxID=3393749 RepID=UPI003B58A06F
MISDWRGDRRIGRPSLGETLSTEIRKPLVAIVFMAVVSAAVLGIRLFFGERYSPAGMVLSWCITFAVLDVTAITSVLLARRWTQAWLLLGLSAALIGLVWLFALPVLSAIGLLPDAVIVTRPR